MELNVCLTRKQIGRQMFLGFVVGRPDEMGRDVQPIPRLDDCSEPPPQSSPHRVELYL
jgi:hypothetical protein